MPLQIFVCEVVHCSQKSRGSITQVPYGSACLTGRSSADARAEAAVVMMPVIVVCLPVPGWPMLVPGALFLLRLAWLLPAGLGCLVAASVSLLVALRSKENIKRFQVCRSSR